MEVRVQQWGHLLHASVPTKAKKLFPKYLTSFLAFLRRFGLLGKAGVQPGGGLAVVTEAQKGAELQLG